MGLKTLEPTAENLKRFGLAVTLGGAEVRMIDMAELTVLLLMEA